MLFERRYAEFRQEGRTLIGTAISYGDIARLPFGSERFTPGAFGDLSKADAILNVQHDRAKPLARTQGGGLYLEDSSEALRIRAEIPDTRDGEDALKLVAKRVLRGLSLEFRATKESMDDGNVRVVEQAILLGVGLVDRPAYTGSSDVSLRRGGRGVSGRFRYGETKTIRDRGSVRKVRVRRGAFAHSLADPDREITLTIGSDPGKLLASKRNGSLQLQDSASDLRVIAEELPDVSYVRDLRAQLDHGFEMGVEPLYRIPPASVVDDATALVAEAGNPGVMIEEIREATLFGISVQARPGFPTPDVARRSSEARLWL